MRSDQAERLSRLLRAESAVQSVHFDEQRSARELLVLGVDLPLLARSLCEVARTEHIALEALTPMVPSLAAGWP